MSAMMQGMRYPCDNGHAATLAGWQLWQQIDLSPQIAPLRFDSPSRTKYFAPVAMLW